VGGLGLALSADFRIATPGCRFSANFSRLGFHHGFGLTVTLPRAVGEQRAADLLHTVKHEGYEPMRQKLMELRQQTRGKAKRKEVDRLIEYVSDRRQMIRYPEFLAKGWQIGSGPMESQCRVVPDRVKGPGKRWDTDNAQAIMALEAMYQSQQCAAYWKLAMSGSN